MTDDELSLELQLSNLIIFCIIVGCLVTFLLSLIMNQSVGTTVAIAFTFFVLCGCLYLSVGKHKPRLAAIIVTFMMNEVVFPVLFFASGGIRSGMICYLIVGMIYPFLSLDGAACIVSFIIAAISSSALILLDHFRIIQSTPLTQLGWVEDLIQSMIIVAVVFGVVFKFQSKVYLRKNEKLSEQEFVLRDAMVNLEYAMVELENASNAKTDFLANMSHEIRTPINAILGFNEMILRDPKSEDIVYYAHDIKAASTTLLNIINDILDFSKIESGKMEIIPVEYDISKLLRELINMITIRAEEKGLELRVDIDASTPRILFGDEVRIKQIILNILTNAVKYTKRGHVILKVSYDKTDDDNIMLKCSIEDTGVGMKEADLARLFKPFERIEESKNRHVEGTGLGMTITKTFLNMMESELKVQSEYGKGSVFSFEVAQKVVDWDSIGEAYKPNDRQEFVKEAYKPKFNAPDARIIVVDDMPLNLKVFASLLKDTRMKIDTAESGAQAIEMCKSTKYDIIFLDHMMPEMDGVETLEILKSDSEGININTLVVVLTANAITGARENYMDNGFDDYMTKPVDPEQLELLICRYLAPEKVLEPIEIEENLDGNVENNNEDSLLEKLRAIEGFDVASGIAAAGGDDIYEMVVEEFYKAAEGRIGMIRDYYAQKDIKKYTIQVHGLKSSAKLAGLMTLSEAARLLEEAGHAENEEIIMRDTDALLDMYEAVREQLATVFVAEEVAVADDAPLIEKSELLEVIAQIRTAIDDFDMNTAEERCEYLGGFKLPDDFVETYKACRKAIDEIEYEDVEEVLAQYVEATENSVG